MRVLCDECQEAFEPKEQTRYLGAMITEKYIVCPHCGKKHIVRRNLNLNADEETIVDGLAIGLHQVIRDNPEILINSLKQAL